ncbi:MAG: mannitol dehydrogenase family protein [Pseudomonadota bacterium]
MSIDATRVPRLTRKGVPPKPGILHIGPGAFFRAFNAVYTDDAIQSDGGNWGIMAYSLRSASAFDMLDPQGGVYTAVTLSPEARTPRVITSISGVCPPGNPKEVIGLIETQDIRIVSLTITEKGYCYSAQTGGLDLDHPDIQADLSGAPNEGIRTVPGFLVYALKHLKDLGRQPFTVLSCDNLPANGRVTRAVVEGFARELDPALGDWISQNVSFPSTMVDRITPATTLDDIVHLADKAGYHDPAVVVHEPFRQWAIEDNFPHGRPAWDKAGAQMVSSVDAHETMKLRCLNGTHSALAYLGYMAGHETIADSVAAPGFADFCQYLWASEIVPTVPAPEGQDLNAYTAALLERYQNPSIRHRTWQIAMDGSQKLPQRILATVLDRMAEGHASPGLSLAIAAWMRYVGGVDEAGAAIDVRDPNAARLRSLSDSATDPARKVAALLTMREVFDPKLAQSATFQADVTSAYLQLLHYGAAQTVLHFPDRAASS